MGWAVGWDDQRQRDVGYGVPATCDHPGCTTEIDRGLGFRCGGTHNLSRDGVGCGLFFCAEHRWFHEFPDQEPDDDELPFTARVCERCCGDQPPFETWSPDTNEWLVHKATDPSWAAWRSEHPHQVLDILIETPTGRVALGLAIANTLAAGARAHLAGS